MEIPDKEEEPYRYLELRLKEAKKAIWVSEEEKKPLYKFAHYISHIGRTVDCEEIENTHFYLIDTFDIIYNLIMEGKYKENNTLANEIIANSEEILGHVDSISTLLEKVIDKTKKLNAKGDSLDVLRIINEGIKNQNA